MLGSAAYWRAALLAASVALRLAVGQRAGAVAHCPLAAAEGCAGSPSGTTCARGGERKTVFNPRLTRGLHALRQLVGHPREHRLRVGVRDRLTARGRAARKARRDGSCSATVRLG
jgi:hypothetical protein